MKRYAFFIDLARCLGCHACEVACCLAHESNGVKYRRVIPYENEATFLSLSCNHCANPECMRVCEHHCFVKTRNGIVLCRSETCDGCGKCLQACPFKALRFNATGRKVIKCDMCRERLADGKKPSCVANCMMGALQVIDLNHIDKNKPIDKVWLTPLMQFTEPSLRFTRRRSRLQCFWRKGEAEA